MPENKSLAIEITTFHRTILHGSNACNEFLKYEQSILRLSRRALELNGLFTVKGVTGAGAG